MDPTSLRRPKFRGPHFEKMRFAVVFLAFFVTLDLASSLTLDQPPSLRPSISSFAISSPAGVRQVNGPDQKHRPPSASRISSIRGGSSGLLASAGGILTSAAVVGASNLFGFAFTVATGSVRPIQQLFSPSHLTTVLGFCQCIDCPRTHPAATGGWSQ